ncbi:DUF3378 domain-containing protein [Candidatus Woesearchaeota archaeon]|nr:DUF3378 domain-containing protein [Candidatus Woesearchaeota archaeon]
MTVFTKVKPEDMQKLKDLGFTASEPKSTYEVIRYKKGNVSATLYTSGKLFFQGKEKDVEKITDKIDFGKEQEKIHFRKEEGWIIGSDESLKGDTFGGITIAAVKADAKLRKKLEELGVADSKKLSDKEVQRLAEEIKRLVPCEVTSLLPEEYNTYKGVTMLLNKYHQQLAKNLQGGTHVVDEYPGCTVGNIRETKAESKYLEVAAASILARAAALSQLSFLSTKAGFELPKGSTHVKEALERMKKEKQDFSKFVKLHFKNVIEFL